MPEGKSVENQYRCGDFRRECGAGERDVTQGTGRGRGPGARDGTQRVLEIAKRSQSGISDGGPAGMYHRLQCSAGRVEISVKWLILFGEWVLAYLRMVLSMRFVCSTPRAAVQRACWPRLLLSGCQFRDVRGCPRLAQPAGPASPRFQLPAKVRGSNSATG